MLQCHFSKIESLARSLVLRSSGEGQATPVWTVKIVIHLDAHVAVALIVRSPIRDTGVIGSIVE